MERPKVLAIIPARGGSKGLPGKNIMMLGNKPLIAWTIESALACPNITRTIVTTDCKKIGDISKAYGAEVPFCRPSELATDTATTADVVAHTIESADENFDLIVLLQPTSPFRTAKDIQTAISIYNAERPVSVVSVCEVEKSPYWTYWLDERYSLTSIIESNDIHSRRQDLQPAFALNGAIYIVGVNEFLSHKSFVHKDSIGFVMGKKSSVDIDDLLDFKFAELLLSEE